MRRARMTYPGAFHHVMNRGHGGEAVFSEDGNKRWFLRILSQQSKEYRIKLLVYSIMDNHYHIVLQNTSGKLSDFYVPKVFVLGTDIQKSKEKGVWKEIAQMHQL